MKLSVSMIVRLEESCLEKCLSSVIDADELVVVDTRLPTDPVDRTREIAESFSAAVYDFPWIDDFAAARNFSLSKCTGDWVFVIDADEVLDPGGMDLARAAIESAGKYRTVGVQCYSQGGGNRHVSPRLFRRCPEVRWERSIHNVLGAVDEYQMDHPSDVVIRYGRSAAHDLDPDRALRILTKVLEENPKAVREAYYLAREYWYRKNYETAAKWYEDYLKRAKWAPEMADAWLMLGRCLLALGRGDEGRDCALQAVKINTDFREALLFLSETSGPKNMERWKTFASLAENEGVLFVRSPQTQPASFYDRIFAASRDMSRYELILQRAAAWARGRVLDVCCGTGELGRYLDSYRGIDFSAEAVRGNPRLMQGDVFADDLDGFDTYVILEALEHLDDWALLARIPAGADVVFSVPSFADQAHLRTYNERIVRLRYAGLLAIDEMVRFNWDGKRWDPEHKDTTSYILLARGRKRSS